MNKSIPVFSSGKFSIRQAFTITNLVILAVGTLFTLLILGVALDSRREEMNLRLANRAETARSEIDLVLHEAENSVRRLAEGMPAAVRRSTADFEAWALREGSARLSQHPGQFDLYFAFTAKQSRKLFRTPGMVYLVSKDPKLAGSDRFHDPASFVILKFPDAAYLTNKQERWYHDAITSQDFYLSPVYFDVTYLKTNMLSVTRAVHDTDTGEILGIVGADLTARSFGQLVARLANGRNGGAILVDENGYPLAPFVGRSVPMIGHSESTPIPEGVDSPLLVPGAPKLPTTPGLHEIRGRDGQRYLAHSRRLNERPYYVVAYQQRSEAFESLYWTLGAIMILAASFLAVSLYFRQKLAAFVIQNIEKILANLQANEQRIQADAEKPFYPAEPAGPREIARISQQLNSLYSRLHSAFDEIRSEKDRAELATRAKSRFLSVMSHEIRTPLNSMLGLTDVLLLSPLSSDQIRHLSALQRSGQSLLRILNDILDFSRLEAGKLEIEQSEFDLYELLYDIENLMRFDAEAKGLRFTVQAPNRSYRLSGDSIRIRQALLNLIGNSIKFTAKGAIEVQVAPLTDSDSDAQLFFFKVVDTGIGMSTEQQSRIFSEFAQADASINRRYGGTGLGLSISKQIVGLLGGHLELQSKLGHGSTFQFTIPLKVISLSKTPYLEYIAAMAEQGGPRTFAKNLKRDTRVHLPETRLESVAAAPVRGFVPPAEHTILVIDDDEDNHRLIDAYMKFRSDLGAVHCFSAKEALAHLQRRDFGLILMDMQMPEMDGLDATREIRRLQAEGKLRRRPIIMVSANTFADDQTKSIESGADEHVGKPLKLDRFKELLDRWIPTG